jgi:hypothetical protein
MTFVKIITVFLIAMACFGQSDTIPAPGGSYLKYYRTPLDYGSACNDVTISAAINDTTYTGAHNIFIPPGTCVLSNPIAPSGTHYRLFGVPGSSILQAGQPIASMLQAYDNNVVIEDLIFDGNTSDVTNAAVVFETGTTFSVRNVVVRNGPEAAKGILVYNSSGTIRDSEVSGFGYQIYVDSTSQVFIVNNYIHDNIAPASGTGGNGIYVNHSAPADSPTVVSGNVLKNQNSNVPKGGNSSGIDGNAIDVFQANGVIVQGNRINSPAYSCVRSNSSNNVLISGNQCINAGESGGISEFTAVNNVWANNYFQNAGESCLVLTNINDNGKGHIATGNQVNGCGGNGIYAEALSTITGNLIQNASPGITAGVAWTGSGMLLVKGNIVTFSAAGGTGISLPTGPTNVMLEGNMITNASTPVTVIPAGVQIFNQTLPYASLGSASDGSFVYCPDCQVQPSCAGGGTGAFAKHIAGAWQCQ